jgi:molybdenum cofactor biosynthesis enzyme MoaA
LTRGADDKTIIQNTCNVPYRKITIDYNSNCLLCLCDGWLPVPVGKVQDFTTIEDVFNSPIAKTLQADVSNKKFTWCAVDNCGIKQQNIILPTYTLAINIDESCNLYCPSCRRAPIMHSSGVEFTNKLEDIAQIQKWLDAFEHPIHIILSGNGDPLASNIIRPLFKTFQPKNNQTFKLFTNGLLIKKQLTSSHILPKITEISISVDAGSKEVYENVRLGGKWEILLENFDYLVSIEKNNLVTLNYAVQKNNYKDLSNFIKLCQAYGFNANIHDLVDWGTWSNSWSKYPDTWTLKHGLFSNHNVLSVEHPEYLKCKEIITNEYNKNLSFVGYSAYIKSILLID